MANNVDPDKLASSEANIWIYTVCKDRVYPGSAGLGLRSCQAGQLAYFLLGFLINMQGQGQQPHQWAPFQIAGLLQAWQISHQISRYVYPEGW